jgi:hypothetical protein
MFRMKHLLMGDYQVCSNKALDLKLALSEEGETEGKSLFFIICVSLKLNIMKHLIMGAPLQGPIYMWATSGPSWPSCFKSYVWKIETAYVRVFLLFITIFDIIEAMIFMLLFIWLFFCCFFSIRFAPILIKFILFLDTMV